MFLMFTLHRPDVHGGEVAAAIANRTIIGATGNATPENIAFVGGSLVDAGGHNLLEPARLRKPVLFGPYTSNVKSLACKLKQNGGGLEVGGAEDLVREITVLLTDPEKRRMVGEKAYQAAATDNAVIDRSINIVGAYLPAPALA